jgi:hypothetical protein
MSSGSRDVAFRCSRVARAEGWSVGALETRRALMRRLSQQESPGTTQGPAVIQQSLHHLVSIKSRILYGNWCTDSLGKSQSMSLATEITRTLGSLVDLSTCISDVERELES